MFTTEKTYGIYRLYGFTAFQMEPNTMGDGRKISVPSTRMCRYLRSAVTSCDLPENIQCVFVAKMLFGVMPISGTFYNLEDI